MAINLLICVERAITHLHLYASHEMSKSLAAMNSLYSLAQGIMREPFNPPWINSVVLGCNDKKNKLK